MGTCLDARRAAEGTMSPWIGVEQAVEGAFYTSPLIAPFMTQRTYVYIASSLSDYHGRGTHARQSLRRYRDSHPNGPFLKLVFLPATNAMS